MPGVVPNKRTMTHSKQMVWGQTPLDQRKPNVSWSEDGTIRIYDPEKTDTFDKFIKNSGITYTNLVAYILYYDTKDKMTYLEDVRDGVLYSIPQGAKAKGYTLAVKLNLIYKDKPKK